MQFCVIYSIFATPLSEFNVLEGCWGGNECLTLYNAKVGTVLEQNLKARNVHENICRELPVNH